MLLKKLRSWTAVAAVALSFSPHLASADVVVFAAASATESITEIGDAFAAKGLGKITPSYASSSTLAKQIENGAPAGVFLSADQRWMDYLADKKLVAEGTRSDLLGNRVALIAPKDSKIELTPEPGFALAAALGKDGRLAVGDPAHVPVGAYTQAALEKLGVWDQVKDRLAAGDSVRAALAYVERGETPLGIVYSTDAAASDKVRVVSLFPTDSHPPVLYPVGLIAGHDDAEAHRFLDFLHGPEAKAVFAKHGFEVK